MIFATVSHGVNIGLRAREIRRRTAQGLHAFKITVSKPEPRVPVTVRVHREGKPSGAYMSVLQDVRNDAPLAYFAHNLPQTQWFLRVAIHREVIATAYEYTSPRLGMTRWPTIGDDANNLLFNIVEGAGENQVSTVDAKTQVVASVDSRLAIREAVIVERMDDGQWRVAGYGKSLKNGAGELDLKVTTSGTLFALGLDDWGSEFVPSLPVTAGQRVRPTQFVGWLYEIAESGTLPPIEPQWWAAEGDNASRPLGTARAIAVRYYRPLAHGPIPVEMT